MGNATPSGGGGNGLITLTGDITGSGKKTIATTLATVNSNVGTFALASLTVNAKGLITAASAASTTGSGNVVLATSPTIVTPTIASFTNAIHPHTDAAGGGTLSAIAIASGTLALARGGTNADLSATGAANSFLKQSSAGAAVTVGAISASDITTALTTPGAIGGTTPAAGAFTTLSASGTLTLSGAPGKIIPAANSTTALQIANAAGTAFVTFDTTNSRVGIGLTPGFPLDVSLSSNATLSQAANLLFIATSAAANASLSAVAEARWATSGTINALSGLRVVLHAAAAGAVIGAGSSVAGLVRASNTGTVTTGHAVSGQGQTSTGSTLTNLSGFRYLAPTNNSGSITNEYGVYIEDVTAGTTLKYAVFTNAGLVHFGDNVEMANAKNVVLNTTTGTKIGTATTQKLAFYNATPIVQRASAAQANVVTTAAQLAGYGYATQAQADAIVTLANELRDWAVAIGFIKGSA